MVLIGLEVFWGVLEAHPPPHTTIHPTLPTLPTTRAHPNPPAKKARHSPPPKVCTENAKVCTENAKVCTENAKVCTENLTKFPKYDTIKAVLVEINRTERGAQAPEKKTKQTKKENNNETRKKTRHHQGKHPISRGKISRPQLESIQERTSRTHYILFQDHDNEEPSTFHWTRIHSSNIYPCIHFKRV